MKSQESPNRYMPKFPNPKSYVVANKLISNEITRITQSMHAQIPKSQIVCMPPPPAGVGVLQCRRQRQATHNPQPVRRQGDASGGRPAAGTEQH
jgi:hypothetical protein